MNELTMFAGILICCFFISWGLTKLVLTRLIKAQILDLPNNRSSHSTPTPRGGGWALFLTLIPFCFYLSFQPVFTPSLLGLTLAVIFVAMISWIDDLKNISARIRFGTQFLSVALILFLLPEDKAILPEHLPLWLERVILLFGWIWYINLYNFMDGIDGITGIQTACLSASLFILQFTLNETPQFSQSLLAIAILGAILGFLVLNWHPAKIFMGDIGSIPLGLLTGWLLLELAYSGYFWAALILPSYYIIDASLTLFRRLFAGHKFWRAHRQHLYQRACQAGKSPRKVCFSILAFNIVMVISAYFSEILTYGWSLLSLPILSFFTLSLLLNPVAFADAPAE